MIEQVGYRPEIRPFVMTSESPGVKQRQGIEQFYTGSREALKESVIRTCSSPYERQQLLSRIDVATSRESNELKARSSIFSDVFIIGTGPHATVFAQQMKHFNPDIDILFGEKDDVRGGHFRKTPEPYILNSPNVAKSNYGFKYEKGEPNDLGSNALIQSKDLSTDPFPESTTQGIVNAINSFHSAPSLVGTRILSVERNTSKERGTYKVSAIDEKTKKPITIYTNVVVGALGLGEPNKSLVKEPSSNVLSFPEFMDRIDGYKAWSMSTSLSRGVAIVGGADSALVTLEKLIELRQKKYIPLGPITIYGADFKTAEEFERKTIERYKHLAKYMPSESRINGSNEIKIRLVKERVESILPTWIGANLKTAGNDRAETFGTIIMANGYRNTKNEIFKNFNLQSSLKNIYDREISCAIGQQISGENIFLIGPAANIAFTNEELTKIPENMQARYINSLKRLTPRTEKLADNLARFYSSRYIYNPAA